jgi:hypothetical protein
MARRQVKQRVQLLAQPTSLQAKEANAAAVKVIPLEAKADEKVTLRAMKADADPMFHPKSHLGRT